MADDPTAGKDGEKLDRILGHMDALHAKHDATDAKITALGARHDTLEQRIDKLEKGRADTAMGNIGPEEEAAAQAERERIAAHDAEQSATGIQEDERARRDRTRRDADREHDELPEFVKAQEKADAVARAFGDLGGAPRWLAGEGLLDYRRRLLSKYTKFSKDWQGTNVLALDATALPVVETRVYADALIEAEHPTDVQPGRLREVMSRDKYGRTITKFYGDAAVAYAPFAFNGLIRRVKLTPVNELRRHQ